MIAPLPLTVLAVSILAVVALILSEYRGSSTGIWITKPMASLGFVVFAILCGAFQSTYGLILFAGLVLACLGDLLLIPKSEKIFQGGVLAFLLGHVFYTVAFARLGFHPVTFIISLTCILVAQFLILRWLVPHVPASMKSHILAYILAISLMVVFAASASSQTGHLSIAFGAFAFFLSDLSVARDKFVQPGFINKLWGLPLYYGAQFVLAGTASFTNP